MEDEPRYSVICRYDQGDEEDAYPGSKWDEETAAKLRDRLNASELLTGQTYTIVPAS